MTESIDDKCQHDPLDEDYWSDLMVCPWMDVIDQCKYRCRIEYEDMEIKIDKIVCAYNYRKNQKKSDMPFEDMVNGRIKIE